jgi:hypothetical protein
MLAKEYRLSYAKNRGSSFCRTWRERRTQRHSETLNPRIKIFRRTSAVANSNLNELLRDQLDSE